jgi:hypothetical protein
MRLTRSGSRHGKVNGLAYARKVSRHCHCDLRDRLVFVSVMFPIVRETNDALSLIEKTTVSYERVYLANVYLFCHSVYFTVIVTYFAVYDF